MRTLRQLWSMLPPDERLSTVGLLAIMLVSTLLEMLGVGLIMPLLGVLLDDPLLATSQWIPKSLQSATFYSRTALILFALKSLIALYAIKAAFLIFATWQQVSFICRFQSDVSRRLLATYLYQPWTFHLQRNSAELVRNLTDIPSLAFMCSALLGTIAELMILAGLLVLLFMLEPLGATCCIIILTIALWALEYLTRARLTRWGDASQLHAAACYKTILESLTGAKEVKIRGCEQTFVNRFCIHRDVQVRMQGKQMLFGQIPRLWYELVAVCALCTLTILLIANGKSAASIVPTLGLFAAAAFRMLPSANRLAHSLQNLRYSAAVVNTISEELKLDGRVLTQPPLHPLTFRTSIEITGVTYRHPDSVNNSLEHITLRVARGQSVGIIGDSGAGKSTLIDVMLGLLTPASGRVLVDGLDIAGATREWQQIIGYVPQSIHLTDDTLRRNIAFGVPDHLIDDEAYLRAIKLAHLEDFFVTLPKGSDTIIGEQGIRLSGGQRQRIGIARALYHDPDVLVLDEATSALDVGTESLVMRDVTALHGEKTLIIVTHRLSTLEHCDVVVRLDKGRIIQSGPFAELLAP